MVVEGPGSANESIVTNNRECLGQPRGRGCKLAITPLEINKEVATSAGAVEEVSRDRGRDAIEVDSEGEDVPQVVN